MLTQDSSEESSITIPSLIMLLMTELLCFMHLFDDLPFFRAQYSIVAQVSDRPSKFSLNHSHRMINFGLYALFRL